MHWSTVFFYKTMIVWRIIALKHFWVEKKVNIRSLWEFNPIWSGPFSELSFLAKHWGRRPSSGWPTFSQVEEQYFFAGRRQLLQVQSLLSNLPNRSLAWLRTAHTDKDLRRKEVVMAISASSEFRLWGNFALFTLLFSCYLFFVHWLVGEGSKTSFKVYIAPKCFVDHTTFNLSFFIWCIIYTLYIATTYQSVLYSTPHSIFPILRRISCIKNWKTTSTETEHEFVSH